jgi:sugar phosphate isomerase/epimerase
MTTRREAITTLGAAAGLMGLRAPYTLRPASSTPSPPHRAPGIASVGLQLYTVRSEMRNGVDRTLARVAEIGYEEVEFAGYFDHSAEQIRRFLDDNGLRAPASHIGIEQMENQWDMVADFAATVGHRYIVVASIDAEARKRLDDYRRMMDRFNVVAERAEAAGITFGYHNHDFEFEMVEDQVPFDLMLEHADPAIQFEMDLFWIIQGGGDPLDYFRRYPGRFPMVHVKDMAPDGSMVDVGAGEIDFAKIFAQSDRAGIQHYFVEHDNPSSPFGSIRASYDYLRGLEF